MNHSHPALATIVGILTAVVAVCVFLVAANYWSFWPYDNPSGVACTMEAKLCPDGSSVGRTGPKCEFAPCPTGAIYRMEMYGLMVKLPNDWSGYSVRTETWEGTSLTTGAIVASGPKIILRHPAWTESKPYEDLPILVFSPAQWRLVSSEKISLGAAPIEPSLLASSSEYVFALPARYNYDFSEGFQALDDAIRAGAISAVEPIHY